MVSNPTYDPNPLVSTSLHDGAAGVLQLCAEGPRGLLPAAPHRHRRDLLPRLDDEGGDVHRGLQPQALPGGLQLSGPAVPDVPRLEPAPLRRREQPEHSSVRRDHDVHAAVVVRPRLRRARRARGRVHAAPAGRAVRHQLGAPHRPAEQRATAGGRRRRLDAARRCRRTPRPSRPTTAIGQDYVQDTALQNAMVAAGIANGGVVMTPHLMSSIHDSQGALVQSLHAHGHATDGHRPQAAQSVTVADGERVPSGHGVRRGLPVLPVRRRQDRDGPDGSRSQPRLDDRFRAGQQPARSPWPWWCRFRTSRPTAPGSPGRS